MLFWTRGNSVDAHNQLILTLYLQVCRITRAGSRSKPTQFMGLLILWIWSNELNLTNTKLARSAWIRVWIRRLIFGWLILSITLLSINLQSMFPFVLVVNVISLIDLTFCSDLIFKALGPLYRGALVRNNENSQSIYYFPNHSTLLICGATLYSLFAAQFQSASDLSFRNLGTQMSIYKQKLVRYPTQNQVRK